MTDSLKQNQNGKGEYPACFAEALAEELVEINELRRKREKKHDPMAPQKTSKWEEALTIALEEIDVQPAKREKESEFPAPPEGPQWEEVQRIAREAGTSDGASKDGARAAEEAETVVGQARNMKLAGLAFSGGGIRSATFNLGVLQGLAQYNKVRTFDYLSTVSGGGYIGSWLTTWIKRRGPEPKSREAAGDEIPEGIHVVEEELRPTRAARQESVKAREGKDEKSHTEPPQVRFLRDYSNYLTPRLGALGADTWAVIAIYFRNLLLNQAILILFLFALLLGPYIVFWVTHDLGSWLTCLLGQAWVWVAPPFVFALMTFALCMGARNMRWLTDPDFKGDARGDTGSAEKKETKPQTRGPLAAPQDQRRVMLTVVGPFFVAMLLVTAWLWPLAKCWGDGPSYWWITGGVALMGLPLGIGTQVVQGPPKEKISGERRLAWFGESLITGAASGLLMKAVVVGGFSTMQAWPGADWHELSLGVPLTLVVFLLAATIQLGLMGTTFWDPNREWWSRVAALVMILTIAWAAGFGVAVYAPPGLLRLGAWLGSAAGLGWIGSTLTGVLGGKSEKTGSAETGGLPGKLLQFTPYVFIVGLLGLLSLALELILTCIGIATDGAAHFLILDPVLGSLLVPGWIAVVLACVGLSWRVDLNEFSMNLMYRNRLVRCYLGATNEKRWPNPFLGLDPGDDMLLSTLRSEKGYSGPLPILNGTLNLVDTRDLAWQERKAEAFPMTPWRCGFDVWIEQADLDKTWEREQGQKQIAKFTAQSTDNSGDIGQTDVDKTQKTEKDTIRIAKYAYRPTTKYAYPPTAKDEDGGFYVGTAMSISGAAASPNMGYHSAKSLAILMTFFNVRLGFWAGNPRDRDTWKLPGPTVGLHQLVNELFGLTDDNAKYVYLSDGGHFENLGVYELVKRRCKYIVACDAGADPDYSFEDLGNAIRKCREDVGVEIEVDTSPLVPKSSGADGTKGSGNGKKQTAQHCVVGTIHYEMADPEAEPGIFIYIKASLTGDEPADVLNYQTSHSTFPHESTVDQWFTESQFESYRRLGQHVVETLFAGSKDSGHHQNLLLQHNLVAIRNRPTEALFEELKDKWPNNSPRRRQEAGTQGF